MASSNIEIDSYDYITILENDSLFGDKWKHFCQVLKFKKGKMHDLKRMYDRNCPFSEIIMNILQHWIAIAAAEANPRNFAKKLRDIECNDCAESVERLSGLSHNIQPKTSEVGQQNTTANANQQATNSEKDYDHNRNSKVQTLQSQQPHCSTSTISPPIQENTTADSAEVDLSSLLLSNGGESATPRPGCVKTVMEKCWELQGTKKIGKVRVFVEDMKYLLNKVGKRKLIFISICGKTRSGKSFMLSLFIHYLKSGRSPDWIKSFHTDPNKFFQWEGGSNPKTDGVSIWSEPFFLKEPNGEEIAVVLMDCQGAFDKKTTSHQNSLIFALSSLLSSVFIYNVKGVITEEAIQPFLVFMNTALRAGAGSSHSHSNGVAKLLQKLVILNRDVNDCNYKYGNYSTHSFPIGASASRNLFKDTFQPTNNPTPEVIESRKHILANFEQVEVFALPYPGYELDREDDPSKLKPEFMNYSTQFMESFFSPRNISKNTKTIQGQAMTGVSCFTFFAKLAETFNSDNLPQIRTFYENFVENENNKAKSAEMAKFKEKMAIFVAADIHGVSDEAFRQYLDSLTKDILASFQKTFLFGGEPLKKKFAQHLEAEMLECSKSFKTTNDRKREAKISADQFAKERKDKEVALHKEKVSLKEAEQIKEAIKAIQKQTIDQAEAAVDHAKKQLTAAQNGKSLITREHFMYNKAYDYTKDAHVGTRVVTEVKSEFNQGQYNTAMSSADADISDAENKLKIAKEHFEKVKKS